MRISAPAAVAATSALVLVVAGLQSRILADWWLENLAIAIFFGALAMRPQLRGSLSTASLWMLFALLCLHEYGAAHAYATPLGEWMRGIPGLSSRNHYDRVVHFLYGVLTVRGFRELAGGSSVAAVQAVLASSALYEIFEWLAATIVDPNLGTDFVGAQGDTFDAAKDMALAFIGSLLAIPWLRRSVKQ